MKIKMKVKTLIGIIVGVLVLVLIIVPLANLTIANFLNDKDSDKAQIFYDNYMTSPIRLNEKQALYQYGMSLVKGFEKFTIKFNGWGGGEPTSPENMEKAMELFEKVLLMTKEKNYKNGHVDEYYQKAYLKLLDTSIATLDIDKLAYWIEWGKDDENHEIRYMSRLYEAYYFFVEKDYSKAKEILEGFDEEEFNRKYDELMGDVNLRLGNVEKAKEYYKRQVERETRPRASDSDDYFGGSNSYFPQYEIEDYIDKSQGQYKIKGKVSFNGKGLPFVDIYLSEDLWALRVPEGKADAITDKNGEFEILGAKAGVYEIGIGIHPSQLYNKVLLDKNIHSIALDSDMEFDFNFVSPMKINQPKDNILVKDGENIHISWDKVKGADYYKVESLVFSNPMEKRGSHHNVPILDENREEKLKKNNIDFSLENTNKRIVSLFFEGEEELVNSTGIFGSFIPGVEYPIIVKAFDKEDNQVGNSLTLISDYKDIVSIEIAGELKEGEKLILDKKYEEAISHYEERLIENPKDKDALFYLARIYAIGWKKGKKDIPKALIYAERYDELYHDYNLSFEVVSFMDGKDMEENKERVKEILEKLAEDDRDTSYYSLMALYYLMEEDYIRARESYENMTDYKYIDMIYIDMYLGNYQRAIDTLESGELIWVKMNTIKVIEALKHMEKVSKKDIDLFKKLLKGKLDSKFSRDQESELYYETLPLINSMELKKLLSEIAKEEYWEKEYR